MTADTKTDPLLIRTVIASQFAPSFMFSSVAVALPSIGAELHAGAVELGLIETIYMATSVAFMLIMGKLADVSDKKTLYKFGLLLFGVSSLLISITSSIYTLLFLRFLQGIAVAASVSMAVLADIAPPGQRGKIFGKAVGSIYAGLLLGPVIAGILIEYFDWRAVFILGGTILTCMSIFVHIKMPSGHLHIPQKMFHFPSMLLIVGTIYSLVAGCSFSGQTGLGYLLIFLGFLFGFIFIRLQKNLEKPLLDVRFIFGNEIIRHALLTQLLLYFNAFCATFILSIYLQVSLHHSAQLAGQILAVGTLFMTVLAPFAGSLSDRRKPQAISFCGICLIFSSTLLGVFLNADSSLFYIALMVSLQGLGFALFSSPNNTLLMNAAPPGSVGMITAVSGKFRQLGMIFGILITTLLISHFYGNDPIAAHPERFIEVAQGNYRILSVLTFITLCMALRELDIRVFPSKQQ